MRHAVAAALFAAALAAGAPAVAQPKPPPAAAAASPADKERALALYTKGGELFKARKFVQALDQFRQSYALVKSPNSHLYIARCQRELGEARAAYVEFDKVAEEAGALAVNAPKYVETQRAAEQERDDLSAKLAVAYVNVSNADATTTIRLGSYDVPSDRWGRAFPIEPGTVDLTVYKGGRLVMKQTITFRAGDKRPVTANAAGTAGVVAGGAPVAGGAAGGAVIPAKPSSINGLRVGAIVAGGVGVVGLAMFIGAGVASKSTYNSLVTTCGSKGGCGTHNVSSQISSGKTQQAIANAGLAIGIIGVAAGATLLAVSLRKPKDAAQPTADLVVKPSWVGAEGTF
jgi:tetratricopeptide (TPR) repeat protein